MYPRAFIDYLVYFHCFRDYFECHEVMEEYWKKEDQNNKLWVGFIQLAVAMYHYRRDNFLGAEKLINKALNIFQTEKKQLNHLGFEINAFITLLTMNHEGITKRLPYSPISFPITNNKILASCQKKAKEKGVTWGEKNDSVSNDIIHKHKVRDRTEIIAARNKQKK